jgi:hypothetical protein
MFEEWSDIEALDPAPPGFNVQQWNIMTRFLYSLGILFMKRSPKKRSVKKSKPVKKAKKK